MSSLSRPRTLDGKLLNKSDTLRTLTQSWHSAVCFYLNPIWNVAQLFFIDSTVTLYPLPDLVPPTPLAQVRKAFSFASNSTVESVLPDGKVQSFEDAAMNKGIPTVVTYLVVGCQRKIYVYSWRDGEAQEVKVGGYLLNEHVPQ